MNWLISGIAGQKGERGADGSPGSPGIAGPPGRNGAVGTDGEIWYIEVVLWGEKTIILSTQCTLIDVHPEDSKTNPHPHSQAPKRKTMTEVLTIPTTSNANIYYKDLGFTWGKRGGKTYLIDGEWWERWGIWERLQWRRDSGVSKDLNVSMLSNWAGQTLMGRTSKPGNFLNCPCWRFPRVMGEQWLMKGWVNDEEGEGHGRWWLMKVRAW